MEKLQTISFGFGELLKTYRKRKRMTQRQLAQRLSVHANTISSWELGTYLPATRGLILELARHLGLDESETRQLLEASLTAYSPYWHIPFPRNPFFTGREEILEELHRQLSVDQTGALTQSSALHGLGGVGKTQIALEYAYRYALEYSAVFWMAAETAESCISSLLYIAETLQLPGREDRNQQRVIAMVQHWLSTHTQWLLICDNVEDLDLLQDFLPTVRAGAMLLTTRCQALGVLTQGLNLSPMESEEGLLFLLRRAKVVALEAESPHVQQHTIQTHPTLLTAATLVKVLGGLPLALDQAGAYIEETGCSIENYLSLYQQQPTPLLDRRGHSGKDHSLSVTGTFRLSLERIEQEHNGAADILRVCALLHADAIPEEVFVEGATQLGPSLATLVSDPAQFNAALAVLRTFSLVDRQAETHLLSLHRLVQAVLQDSLAETERHTWMARVLGAINHLFPVDDEQPDYWQRCARLLPHAQVCLSWREQGEENVPRRIALLNHVAAFVLRRSRLAEAESLYQQAYSEAEHMPRSEPMLFAETLDGLADLRVVLARYEEAEPLYQRAWHLRERAGRGDHPQVATSLSGLASLYWRQGKYGAAEAHYQRSLAIRKRAFGADHPQVASSLSELAIIYRTQGKYEQAESLYYQALHIREQAFGRADPHVALSLHHLAVLYLEQARYEEAKPLFFSAIHIWEAVLGPEDLDLAFALTGLAKLLSYQNSYEEAEALFLRALRIREPLLGSEHPQVALVHHGLANLYLKQGRDEWAEHHYHQAILIQEKHLDQQHTDTAETLHDLALLRQSQGKRGEAIFFAGRALKIRSQALGERHAQTLATQTLYTRLLQE